MTTPAPGILVPLGIDLDTTIGALLIGTFVSVALFGFTTLQAYNYYLNYPGDQWKIKSLVVAVWALEFIHVVFVTKAYYVMGVTGFGTFQDFVVLPFTLKFSIFWSTSISCLIQVFFAHRIRIMSGRWEWACVCWVLSALRYAIGMLVMAKQLEIDSQIDFNAQWKWSITVVLVTGAVNDLLIAAGLTYFLRKNRSGLQKTDLIINKIIRFTIETGLLTSILATTMLILYLTRPDDFIWLAVFVVLARTYSNTFLATLNARNTLRSGQPHMVGSNGLSITIGSTHRTDMGTEVTAGTTLQGGNLTSRIPGTKSYDKPIAIEMLPYKGSGEYPDNNVKSRSGSMNDV